MLCWGNVAAVLVILWKKLLPTLTKTFFLFVSVLEFLLNSNIQPFVVAVVYLLSVLRFCCRCWGYCCSDCILVSVFFDFVVVVFVSLERTCFSCQLSVVLLTCCLFCVISHALLYSVCLCTFFFSSFFLWSEKKNRRFPLEDSH